MISRPEIRVLPPEVCNQIAAGEVVERPASVVKELVENALDAGADRITVRLEDGGKELIEVVDNGCGMTPDQARLALQRHATSKISSAADLFGVMSYGFRGEALPSIAAVSRFTLISRTAAMEAAVCLKVEEGGQISETCIGAPTGTRIVVRDLFHSVPARKKFLKTTATERGAVLDRIQRLALAHSHCSFELEHQGRRLLQLTEGDREIDRAAAFLGLEPDADLISVKAGSEGFKVMGYASLPRVQRANSRALYFFVNRRAVRDKLLLQALLKAYEGQLPRGRYPAVVLFFEVEAGGVDVNVHPAKEEVRFAEPSRLFSLLRQALGESLSGYPAARGNDFAVSDVAVSGAGGDDLRSLPGAEPRLPETARRQTLPPGFFSSGGQSENALRNTASASIREPLPSGRRLSDGLASSAGLFDDFSAAYQPRNEKNSDFAPASGSRGRHFFSTMAIVGSLWDGYIVLQAGDECFFLDQHAAHERVLFAELKARREEDNGGSQGLLVPLSLDCSFEEENLARENQEILARIGFVFDFLGPRSLALRAVPQAMTELEPGPVFLATLADLESGGDGRSTLEMDDLLARMACRLAVKANRRLSREEIARLLTRLDATPAGFTCPHGRPLYFSLSRREVERQLQR